MILFGLLIGHFWLQAKLGEESDQMLGKVIVLDGQYYTSTDRSRDSKTWTLSNGSTISWELLKNLTRYDTCLKKTRKSKTLLLTNRKIEPWKKKLRT